MWSKMDKQDNSIDGFVRRPKRIWPDVIVISDGESGGEPSVTRNENLESVVKRQATENDTTGSEILISDVIINAGKKKKKKNKKNKRRKWKKSKKPKRKIKKETDSEESSDSDSDSSHYVYKRRLKHRSICSSSSISSSSNFGSDTESDFDSSDYGSNRRKRQKKIHRRSKKSIRGGKKRHSSSKRNKKTKRSRNSKRLRREKETTDESRSSDSPSSPDNFDPLMSANNGLNNSNQVPNSNSRVMDKEAGASFQNYPWHSNSQYDSSIPEIPTQIVTVSTTTTANDNGDGTQKLDQILPLAQYSDYGMVAGTSQQSPTLADMDAIWQLMANIQDNETQISVPNSLIPENSYEQQVIPDSNRITHDSELANDRNDLLQLILLNESDTEQLPDLNVECSAGRSRSPAINLQRPRPNIDKMLYLSNPERANVCVFCYDSCTNIVNHYKKKHRTEEVYVSRISPKMADRLRGDYFDRFEAKCEKRGSVWRLQAKCFFCEFPRTFNLSYWLDHIRIHTGEYARLCTSCGTNVTSHEHCGFASELIRAPHNLASADLMCFICKSCNFVQIELKNMERHLIKQHGFQNNDLESKYDEKMLLPSKITVCRGRVPTTVQGANGIVASNIRVLDEIVLNTFNNGAPELHVPELNTREPNTPEPNEPTQFESKREIEWEQRLKDIYPRYITDVDNESVVNPWLETKIRKKNIFPANLFDFYKCMHPNCIFSTNEKTSMQDHLMDHCAHIDIGVEKKDPIDIHKKSRNCPYCYLGPFKTVHDLLFHMETIHSSCTYQCSHCYYRCNEMDSIVLHYEKFHPREETNIYVVNNERKFGLDKMERMVQVEEAKDPENITQFHEFECSYCNFESSEVDEMRSHLAEYHSSEFMFVLRRGEKDEYIYVGAISHWTNFKFFQCGEYKAMSRYLDWDQQNCADQPDPFPLVPVLRSDFQFEPSTLQIGEDVKKNRERKFIYRTYADYRDSQTLLFRCGRSAPEFFIQNPQERGSFCAICLSYVGKEDFLCHLKEHQKTHCYFTAEREDLILQHMQRQHCDTGNKNFHYRKFERKRYSWNESCIKCSFACGICSKQQPCLKLAHEHHKLTHMTKQCVETIQIVRSLDGGIILGGTFSFKAYKFCAEPTDSHIGKQKCSVPMTDETLRQHHAKYHANNEKQTQRFKQKLVLCKNNEIFPRMPSETE